MSPLMTLNNAALSANMPLLHWYNSTLHPLMSIQDLFFIGAQKHKTAMTTLTAYRGIRSTSSKEAIITASMRVLFELET
ncbi:hypothetical protein PPEP_a1906 [Pseudoalteromonas peptidolytica F12-50-A1]|uniref:Uncharacterized protein n=1 Tax=Pseudoalteromonas peptidolytica F12-50-A1 TaxID=1315280 RepID=A0A8I0T5J1_9GAMM|nr:hypothetical protein [Pseudoalteromonas peptidolytica F12-50-A1]